MEEADRTPRSLLGVGHGFHRTEQHLGFAELPSFPLDEFSHRLVMQHEQGAIDDLCGHVEVSGHPGDDRRLSDAAQRNPVNGLRKLPDDIVHVSTPMDNRSVHESFFEIKPELRAILRLATPPALEELPALRMQHDLPVSWKLGFVGKHALDEVHRGFWRVLFRFARNEQKSCRNPTRLLLALRQACCLPRTNSMKLLVTAFGPFGGRTQNASSLALAGLKRRHPWLNTRILPVDSVIAPQRLNQALREVIPDGVILLGEAGGSQTIRLETTAWNELDFRIPDIAGRQPRGETIDVSAPEFLCSTLPFDRIHEHLLETGHPVSYSDDPGRYLCNQILFHGLWKIERCGLPALAGFIHLPLESDYPTMRAVDALARVVETTMSARASAGILTS